MVKQNGRHIIRCVTSPVNKVSIAYHTKMGFEIEKGDKKMDGVEVNTNYDGVNQDRVLFVMKLNELLIPSSTKQVSQTRT